MALDYYQIDALAHALAESDLPPRRWLQRHNINGLSYDSRYAVQLEDYREIRKAKREELRS